MAADAGEISAEEAVEWLRRLEEYADRNSLYASMNYYACVGQRPFR
jgi:hypothetical protein